MRKLITAPDGISPFDKEGIAKINLGKDATAEALVIEETRLVQEWTAQEYARNRRPEYPSTGDQWDMIYKDNKNGTTTHAAAVEAVKTKWPKDNSGPVE